MCVSSVAAECEAWRLAAVEDRNWCVSWACVCVLKGMFVRSPIYALVVFPLSLSTCVLVERKRWERVR